MRSAESTGSVSTANAHFNQGNYLAALKEYLRLERQYGRDSYQANIALCIRRLRLKTSKPSSLDDPLSLAELYESIRHRKNEASRVTEGPLVSVIVTAYNTETFIESSIESLLNQTYSNIEIIVVSDASKDQTHDIALRLKKTNRKIRFYRLAANLGTYYAKNYGIQLAEGEFIFFQDSDDACHHERIAYGMGALLADEKTLVARGEYARVDPESQLIVRVNGTNSKLGLITLGVRKKVFQEIGFFNCTTKASDDEFFNRVRSVYGRKVVKNVNLPLYFNTMRPGSLFADMVQWNDAFDISQSPSESRRSYVDSYEQTHNSSSKDTFRDTFSFPRIRDAIPVAADMTKLPNPRLPVIANVCSIPKREEGLRSVIEALAPQCDRIVVYLDGYGHTPSFLDRSDVSITAIHSSDRPGLRDNGKFIELERLSQRQEDAYYITVDDDIRYPVDYVPHLLLKLSEYNDSAVVGTHGVILPSWPRGYFSDNRFVYKFTKGLESDKAVNVLGTGTTAFRASLFHGFNLSNFAEPGMADVYWATHCKNLNVPMICVERHTSWLQEMSFSQDNLFQEFTADDPTQSELVISSAPWSYGAMRQALSSQQFSSSQINSILPSISFHQDLKV
ncbi:glycosyltransferase family 2 protein [Nesterenkonia salmonea]|uniref:Glycosyltransferase family 2 protein n=1 Tax=Nesterenkonia salmonea TaxID=1804987 RepID=A0A5R9B8V7_9MICC|nr:glycosyltransferase family A protein [Nesterenkonia salmonea]TLP94740.1 glycosyltransferase family 2 protein [Nesterenkonia salmonea]